MAASSLFAPHGYYEIVVCQGFVLSRLQGCWNAECVSEFGRQYLEVVADGQLTRWIRIADLREFELGGPDAFEEMAKFYTGAVARGCMGACYVGASGVVEHATASIMELCRGMALSPENVPSVPDAVEWLIAARRLLGLKCEASVLRAVQSSIGRTNNRSLWEEWGELLGVSLREGG